MHIDLESTDTLITLALKRQKALEAARRAQFDAAKTTVGKLMVLGVVTTADDEYDRAMLYQGDQERAKVLGITLNEAATRREAWREYQAIVGALQDIVRDGETAAEHSERVTAHLVGIEGLNAKGRPCTHRTTQREIGWQVADWTDHHYFCGRCGAQAPALPERTEPTEAANIAAALMVKLQGEAPPNPMVQARLLTALADGPAAIPMLIARIEYGKPTLQEAALALVTLNGEGKVEIDHARGDGFWTLPASASV